MSEGSGAGDDPLLPEPFRVLIRSAEEEQDPYRRNWRVIDAIEWSVKWETAVVLGHLLDRGVLPVALRQHLAGNLQRPSLGVWLGTLRIVLEAASERPFADWDVALEAERVHGFVESRNAYAHGAVERDDQAQARYPALRAALDDLRQSRFLTDVGLVRRTDSGFFGHGGPFPGSALLEAATSSRPDWGTFAWVPATQDFIWLWPLAAHLGDPSEGTFGLYFHNALRPERVEALAYELPEQRRDASLFPRFNERAPVGEWLAEDDNPNRGLIEELLADVVGREGLIEDLVTAATGLDPVTVVLGAPGQGKSSVMASVAHRLRTNQEAPVVIDVFLRRQDHASEPLSVLRSIVKRLTRVPGRQPPKMRTLDEASAALVSALTDWHRRSERPVLLLIDGMDEQPEMLRHLPAANRVVRLMWSARPTDEVLSWLMDRRIPREARREVGSLSEQEVRAILYRGVDKLDPRLTDTYVREIIRLSHGNPLFVSGLSDLLFEEPERLGQEDLIPEGVEQIFQSTLDRATTKHDPRIIYETLALLAVAHDRLDEAQIAELSGNRIYDVRAARRALDELVISSPPGDPRARYGLFHDRLRQWVSETAPDEVARVNRRIADLGTVPERSSGARPYLVRHGVAHVRAVAPATDRHLLVEDLVSRLRDPEFGAVWRAGLDGHPYVELLAEVQELRDGSEQTDDLVNLLVALLHGNEGGVGRDQISTEAVHDVLAYRRNREFADRFYSALEATLDPAMPLRPDLALLVVDWRRRRATDEDLRRAQEHLEPLTRRTDAAWATELKSSERARALYQSGYIAHLGDQPERAIASLDLSAELAAEAVDPLHEWVARCVAGRFRSLLGQLDDDNYLELLTLASSEFVQHQATSPMALRWVMNTVSQRLELAMRRGRIDEARDLLLVLESDPWIRSYNQLQELETSANRIRIAAGDAEGVRAALEDRLRSQLERDPRREGVAEMYLDVAQASLACGDRDGARVAAEAGLALPPGSAAWIARPDLERVIAAL